VVLLVCVWLTGMRWSGMYLAGTLVLAVSDEFDDAALVWCKTW
jgi:hypothetical protein